MTYKVEHVGHLSAEGIEELVNLCENSARSSYHFFREADFRLQRPQLRLAIAGIPALYAAKDAATRAAAGVVAVKDGKIALLFVTPELRGHGIGKMLLAKALSKQATRVEVYRLNHSAVAFYQAHGFRIECEFTPETPPCYPSLRLIREAGAAFGGAAKVRAAL